MTVFIAAPFDAYRAEWQVQLVVDDDNVVEIYGEGVGKGSDGPPGVVHVGGGPHQ